MRWMLNVLYIGMREFTDRLYDVLFHERMSSCRFQSHIENAED